MCVYVCLCLYPIIFVINNNNDTHCGHLRLCFENLLHMHTHTEAVSLPASLPNWEGNSRGVGDHTKAPGSLTQG